MDTKLPCLVSNSSPRPLATPRLHFHASPPVIHPALFTIDDTLLSSCFGPCALHKSFSHHSAGIVLRLSGSAHPLPRCLESLRLFASPRCAPSHLLCAPLEPASTRSRREPSDPRLPTGMRDGGYTADNVGQSPAASQARSSLGLRPLPASQDQMRPPLSLRKLHQGWSSPVPLSLVLTPLRAPQANVSCTPSTPAPARKRRRPNQDLQERLSRCEELLKQYANGAAPSPTPTPDQVKSEPSDYTPMSTDSQDSWKPACIMVNEEGGARFMDSYIWASVYEEVSLRSASFVLRRRG